MSGLDISFVKPFILGTIETLRVQCSIDISAGKPIAKKEYKPPKIGIAAVIGITSTTFNGSIAICFPKETFLNVMTGMLGEKIDDLSKEIEDGAGELLNIVFGFAKAKLNLDKHKIEKAIPTVINGDNLKLFPINDQPSVIIPFASNSGDFYIEISLGA